MTSPENPTEGLIVRDRYIAGVPCWIDLAPPDPDSAIRFYGELFGWEFDSASPYRTARLHGHDVAAIGPRPPDAEPAPAWNTYIAVDDADAAAAAVREAGGRVLTEPVDAGDEGRLAVVADPTGAVFRLWQAGTRPGAALVNAPGTWNWSDLNTRDPATAKAFYGRVFGWEADTMPFGGPEYSMWRRPGYGDLLETFEPDLRARQAEAGVPKGFEDAVGWMMTMTDDQFPAGTPPHWHLTFAVDDTDAVADRAKALGATIIVPPYDADFVRVAVVRDPHGAGFTISKYAPPE